MNWRMLDLNLLVVFDAVARERNAHARGDKAEHDAAAISHALSRLRSALRDDLFVRTPDGMVPTPYAEAACRSPSGRRWRTCIRRSTALPHSIRKQPSAASQSRWITGQRSVSRLPSLLLLEEQAPNVQLDIRPSGTLKLAELLDRGELDLAVGGLAAPAERFSDLRLFHSDLSPSCDAGIRLRSTKRSRYALWATTPTSFCPRPARRPTSWMRSWDATV